MLLEFGFQNFKSFKNEAVLSLEANNRLKDIEYSVMKVSSGKKVYSGLCSSVIYGPNASGKTSVIAALDVFKHIILRGNILNADDVRNDNAAAYRLEMIPCSDGSHEPVGFKIKFLDDNTVFEYSLQFDDGTFRDADYSRRVLYECLKINEQPVFERNNNKVDLFLKKVDKSLLNMGTDDSVLDVAKNSLTDAELFLMNGFKTVISKKIADMITDWLRNKLMVICRADMVQTTMIPSYQMNQKYAQSEPISEAAHMFGAGSNEIGYESGKDGQYHLVSTVNVDGRKEIVPAEIYESFGTIRFVNEFPVILSCFVKGGTLLADELDASIHPMALINLINIFHNDDLNLNHAQLIFNTQNPIFLNGSVLRRDEIKFVERDEKTQESVLYSLSDFKTYGDSRARNSSNYMANYFIDKYGAIKNIDFGPIFKEFIKKYGSEKKPE